MVMQVSALPPHAVMVQPLRGVIITAASNPETHADPPVQAVIAGLLSTACFNLHGCKVAGRLSSILQVDALHPNKACLFIQLLDAEMCMQMVMMMQTV